MSLRNPLSLISQLFSQWIPNAEARQRAEAVESRYEHLRLWRNETAKAKRIPPYAILTNRTLLEIATKNPDVPELLLDVKGIGEKKFEQFGADIVRALAEQRPTEIH